MENNIAKKRLIYVISGIIFFGILGYFLYISTKTPREQKQPKEQGVTGRFPGTQPPSAKKEIPGQLPEKEISGAPEARLIRLTDFPVVSAALNKDESRVLFYKKDGGDLFSSDFSGKTQDKISNLTIIGMTEAIWSSVKDRAAIFYLDQETKKGFLHIGTSSVAILPQDIQSFSWSPDGKFLAYLIKKDTHTDLIVADSSGKNQKVVFSSPILEANIQWITTDKIAFATAPSAFVEGFVFLYSRGIGSFNKVVAANGLMALWSPDSNKIITASTNAAGKDLRLVLQDALGKEIWTPAMQTLPEKCFWLSTKEFNCATPRFISPRAVLPDEYLRGEISTTDRIISADTGKKILREIFNEGNFDISNLLATKDQSYLFFVNRKDGALWSYKLK